MAGIAGILAFAAAATRGRSGHAILWFTAGLLLAGGHGLHQLAHRHHITTLIEADSPSWIRARLAVTEGWARGRWGWRTRVRVLGVRSETDTPPFLTSARLEIRGNVNPTALPDPGTVVEGLVSIRGSPRSPLLVASSARLLTLAADRRLLPALRDRLCRRLLDAADTDPGRIRSAELAATLSLGRRDLMPRERREGWRRSGLAHVLAVSGLHVGLLAGMFWLALAVGGVSPTRSRWIILVVLPTYALLAGASPSAVRAALMGMIYLSARLLGRAIVPMAAVLLTATILLISDPSLIAEVSFQLTVVLTAALVRWVPPLTSKIPLPTWPAAAVAVPIVAQAAAAPMVAFHFSTLVPGAAASNLLVPWLLGPVVLASVAATGLAPLSPTLAGWCLDMVDVGSRALWLAGTPGRIAELVPPPLPLVALAVLVLLGLLALLPGRPGRTGVGAYLLTLVLAAGWWLGAPPSTRLRVELLPVSHGLSLLAASPAGQVLVDGGGRRREAAEELARSRVRRLAAVVVSHADEDHIGGLESVLRSTTVDRLVVPAWALREEKAVSLLRTARRRGVRVIPVVRGSTVDLGATRMDVLWPPPRHAPREDNERSMVARLFSDRGGVLVTADIGRLSEHALVEFTDLSSAVLIVPHHGSRGSSSPPFLEAVGASVALIPAGAENLHNHPHPDVVERLEERGILLRMPIRDGRCGARFTDGTWELYP
jgi:competence protein ComEC